MQVQQRYRCMHRQKQRPWTPWVGPEPPRPNFHNIISTATAFRFLSPHKRKHSVEHHWLLCARSASHTPSLWHRSALRVKVSKNKVVIRTAHAASSGSRFSRGNCKICRNGCAYWEMCNLVRTSSKTPTHCQSPWREAGWGNWQSATVADISNKTRTATLARPFPITTMSLLPIRERLSFEHGPLFCFANRHDHSLARIAYPAKVPRDIQNKCLHRFLHLHIGMVSMFRRTHSSTGGYTHGCERQPQCLQFLNAAERFACSPNNVKCHLPWAIRDALQRTALPRFRRHPFAWS
ncbi:hypothetical protein HBH56_104740 [Parastagonospora nodorum]|nr:hypothetical protein HBH56_104740 [Parastagonospora nodorum]KAH3929407.1 hypothetical protein HBH54_125670 [Parastagonospora nodorum]KAH3951609.1 hypothetical protein HBH53_059670 [Parastagonospora nodorum]KAH3978574.1 hypothetical protein HBH51_064100 [Parastagonospora nodorum]KAH3998890.1 hypothetical protein HBI10_120740 [Parastagonospora nodorum]